MSNFKFTLEELTSDPETAIAREMSKGLPNGKAMETTNSSQNFRPKFGVFSMSEVMMGVPAVGDKNSILAKQDKMFSTALAVTLTGKDGTDKPTLGSPFDSLIPSDILSSAAYQAEQARQLEANNAPSKPTDTNGVPGEFIASNPTLIAGISTITNAQGEVISDPQHLLKMSNFQKGFPTSSVDYQIFKNGLAKPELVKCMTYICQQLIVFTKEGNGIRPRGTFRIGLSQSDDDKDGYDQEHWDNHRYYAAIDIYALAHPSRPDLKFLVSDSKSNDLIMGLYSIINSITGIERPDEIGGPVRININDGNGAFYQNSGHDKHIHIGFTYAATLTSADNIETLVNGGAGGVRVNLIADEEFSGDGLTELDIDANPTGTGTDSGGGSGVDPDPDTSKAEAIVKEAIRLSWPDRNHVLLEKTPEYDAALKEAYGKRTPPYNGADCGSFVGLVMRRSGADPNFPLNTTFEQNKYVLANPKLYDIKENAQTSDRKPGDIMILRGVNKKGEASGHIYIYIGDQPNKMNIADASQGERMATLGRRGNTVDESGRGKYKRARLIEAKTPDPTPDPTPIPSTGGTGKIPILAGVVNLATIQTDWIDDRTPGGNPSPRFICIHTMECPDTPPEGGRAASTAALFRSVVSGTHLGVDNKVVLRYALDTDKVNGAKNANTNVLHVELAGRAGQTVAEWADDYSLNVLALAAQATAAWAVAYDIPPVHLVAPARVGGVPAEGNKLVDPTSRGFVGHIDLTNSFVPNNGHWDPGPNFPWDNFLSVVKIHIARIKAGG